MAEMDETLPFELVGPNEERASFSERGRMTPQSRNPAQNPTFAALRLLRAPTFDVFLEAETPVWRKLPLAGQ
ncbi:MAG: hypothetical protein E5Y58_12240 [Mesorhizobium sp.]|nr:MAG: hypothetical protein E5Y58_12240 [Mesorhizobium sp.]